MSRKKILCSALSLARFPAKFLRALEEEFIYPAWGRHRVFDFALGISTAAHSRESHTAGWSFACHRRENSMTSEQHELIVAVTDADGGYCNGCRARSRRPRRHCGQGPRGVRSETAQSCLAGPFSQRKSLCSFWCRRHSPDGDAGHHANGPANAPARFHLFAACQGGAGPALIPRFLWGFYKVVHI